MSDEEFEAAPLSPQLALFAKLLEITIASQIQQISDSPQHTLVEGIAVHAQAMGDVVGSIQAAYEVHGKECADCAKLRRNYKALFHKNFDEAYTDARKRGHARRERAETDAEKSVAELMERVLGKAHK